MPYCSASNDLWGRSHFNFDVDGRNYHVLRTGAFPFIKFHCSLRPKQDLTLEDNFYRALKVINFGESKRTFLNEIRNMTNHFSGIPTFLYGIAGLLWAKHTEEVHTPQGKVTIYFWYKETEKAQH